MLSERDSSKSKGVLRAGLVALALISAASLLVSNRDGRESAQASGRVDQVDKRPHHGQCTAPEQSRKFCSWISDGEYSLRQANSLMPEELRGRLYSNVHMFDVLYAQLE